MPANKQNAETKAETKVDMDVEKTAPDLPAAEDVVTEATDTVETVDTTSEEETAPVVEEPKAEDKPEPEAEPQKSVTITTEVKTVPPTNVAVPDVITRSNVPVYKTPGSSAPFTLASGTFKVLGEAPNGLVKVAFAIGGIGRVDGYAEAKYFKI